MTREPERHRYDAAALLRFAFGKKDKEIAPLYGKSDVSQWIKRAYESQDEVNDRFIVARHYELTSFTNLYQAMLKDNAKRSEMLSVRLEKYLTKNSESSFLPQIYIIEWPQSDDQRWWDKMITVWAHIASFVLLPKLFNARVTSIAWGRHLRALVDSISLLHAINGQSLAKEVAAMCGLPSPISVDAKQRATADQRIIFPFLGDPLTAPESKADDPWDSAKLRPSALVEDLANAIDRFQVLHLRPRPTLMPGVAGFIPMQKDGRGFDDKEAKIVKDFFGHSDGYVRVFGKEPAPSNVQSKIGVSTTNADALADNVDTILLGAGTPKIKSRFWIREFIQEGNVKKEDLEATIGDMGGILMWKPTARRGPTREQVTNLESVASRITGVSEKQVFACASRERERRASKCADDCRERLGVCVLATQTDRAEPLLEAIERGWVNSVVICDNVERGLLDQLPAPSPKSRSRSRS